MWNVIRRRASLIREPNEVRILRLVRDRRVISRIEIAKATGLHKATVTDVVVKLMRAGFLEETGQVVARKRVGRKRVLLQFRPMAGLVAGVDIGMTRAVVAITDLNARILQQKSFEYSLDTPAKDVLSTVADTVESLLAVDGHSRSELVGIGIGVQGVIDYSNNKLLVSYNKKGWEGESLSTLLETRFGVPVYVENDVKTMALGEYLLGAAKGAKDFVHIYVGDGLGAGIMINGRLLHGLTSSAGEIGYNALEFPPFYAEKFPLTYRDQAMFGEILTDANLITSYQRHSPQSVGDALSVSAIAERAIQGDPVASQVIEEYASLLSMLSISIVNLLNPELIIVGGKLVQYYPSLPGMLEDKIHRDLLAPPAEAVRVRGARHAESGVILGAASLILYELFEPLHHFPARGTRRQSSAKAKEAGVEQLS